LSLRERRRRGESGAFCGAHGKPSFYIRKIPEKPKAILGIMKWNDLEKPASAGI
jgi:hypothetical protein